MDLQRMSFAKYLNQDFDQIKASNLKYGTLFEDEEFPACNGSLFRFKSPQNNGRKVFWMRPFEIVDNPVFIADNKIIPNNFDQEKTKTNWLVSAFSTISSAPEYVQMVVPENQSFDENSYAGVFHFRLWHFGEWTDIVIDDFLPVNENGKLIFCQNKVNKNEMFGPLLEKAFAKLNSCYEFLIGINPIDAMIDMTGGVHEAFKVKGPEIGLFEKVDEQLLWEIIFKSFLMKSLCETSIVLNDSLSPEQVEEKGLVIGQTYALCGAYELYTLTKFDSIRLINYDQMRTSLDKIITEKPPIRLLKMRNPWGVKTVWNGAWSYKSEKWKKLSQSILGKINPYTEEDLETGTFFVTFEEYCKLFDSIDFLHVNLNAFFKSDYLMNNHEFKWLYQEFHGQWVPGINSGGSGMGNYYDQEAYWLNPQYFMSLPVRNKYDDKVSMIVSLMQTEQVRKRSETDGTYENSNEGISFSIFSINDKNVNVKLLNNQKFTDYELKKVGTSGAYLAQREVTKRVELPPGTYVIIPSLHKKNKRMKFVLRVYVEGDPVKDEKESPDLMRLDKQKSGTSKDLKNGKSATKKPLALTENGEIEKPENEETSKVCTII